MVAVIRGFWAGRQWVAVTSKQADISVSLRSVIARAKAKALAASNARSRHASQDTERVPMGRWLPSEAS